MLRSGRAVHPRLRVAVILVLSLVPVTIGASFTGAVERVEESFAPAVRLSPDESSRGFGSDSMALDGDLLAIGTYDETLGNDAGAVYLFRRDAGGDRAWGRIAKLTASDGSPFDAFGGSVALSGDRLVVGASGAFSPGSAGAVYVFEPAGGSTEAWSQVAKILPTDGPLGGGRGFGSAVATDGRTIVIGAESDGEIDIQAGAAYVFERGIDGAWRQVTKLLAADGVAGQRFGHAVAADASTAVIATHQVFDAEGPGEVYVFERRGGSDGAWVQTAKLVPPDLDPWESFGTSVALDGDTVAAGTLADSGEGRVRLFDRDAGGGWAFSLSLEPRDASPGYFGNAVDLAGDTLVVGAFWDDDADREAGSVYVFRRGVDGGWGQLAKLISPRPERLGNLGTTVAVDAEIVAGAPREGDAGVVTLFEEVRIDPFLAADGSCPGIVSLAAAGLTPGGRVRLYGALTEGHSDVADGPCVGVPLGLTAPRLLIAGSADAEGGIEAAYDLGEGACAAFLQLIDETCCATGNVLRLPPSPASRRPPEARP